MVPAKLKRYLITKHPELSGKYEQYVKENWHVIEGKFPCLPKSSK